MALGELKNGIGSDAYAIYQQVLAAVVERDHPVGSLYISENAASPAELYGGTWERIEDCTIWGASGAHPAGTTIEAGLPNITGGFEIGQADGTAPIASIYGAFGALYGETSKGLANISMLHGAPKGITIDASKSSSIYGASDTVQPPAYCMYIWRRVA